VRAQIQQTLAAQIADRQITDRARDLAARLKTPADMDKAAAELMLKVEESGFFQKDRSGARAWATRRRWPTRIQLQENAVSEPLASSRGPVFVHRERQEGRRTHRCSTRSRIACARI
jgi:hypothetical protein